MRWRQKSAEEPHRAPVSVQEVREKGPSACSLGPMPSDTVIIVSESAPRDRPSREQKDDHNQNAIISGWRIE